MYDEGGWLPADTGVELGKCHLAVFHSTLSDAQCLRESCLFALCIFEKRAGGLIYSMSDGKYVCTRRYEMVVSTSRLPGGYEMVVSMMSSCSFIQSSFVKCI